MSDDDRAKKLERAQQLNTQLLPHGGPFAQSDDNAAAVAVVCDKNEMNVREIRQLFFGLAESGDEYAALFVYLNDLKKRIHLVRADLQAALRTSSTERKARS